MPPRDIVLYPDPVLRARAADVDPADPRVADVLRDLRDTLEIGRASWRVRL